MSGLREFLVAGANGRFGQIFCHKLRTAGAAVTGVDVQPKPAIVDLPYLSASISSPADRVTDAIRRSDCVLMCVPEQAVLQAIPPVMSLMRADALLVDIASVKSRIAEVVGAQTWVGAYLSIHPMFGPVDDFSGRSICGVSLLEGEKSLKFQTLITETWRAKLTMLSADEHDRAAAYVQALPHAALMAFGAALLEGPIPIRTVLDLATPVQQQMLALVARLGAGSPDTYRSIQTDNPHAAQARQLLEMHLRKFSRLAETGDGAGFAAEWQKLGVRLRPFAGELSPQSRQALETFLEHGVADGEGQAQVVGGAES